MSDIRKGSSFTSLSKRVENAADLVEFLFALELKFRLEIAQVPRQKKCLTTDVCRLHLRSKKCSTIE